MTRRLILMRHAKSDWTTDAPTDHLRPLNKRGRRDAPRMGRLLLERGWRPDRVILSDSARTQETLQRLGLDLAIPARLCPEIYEASDDALLDALRRHHDDARTLLLIGHSPGLDALLTVLTGAAERLTTANLALLDARRADDAGWDDLLLPHGWLLTALLRPRG